jgi:hypothetical protein
MINTDKYLKVDVFSVFKEARKYRNPIGLCVHVCVLCLGEVNELFPGDGT